MLPRTPSASILRILAAIAFGYGYPEGLRPSRALLGSEVGTFSLEKDISLLRPEEPRFSGGRMTRLSCLKRPLPCCVRKDRGFPWSNVENFLCEKRCFSAVSRTPTASLKFIAETCLHEKAVSLPRMAWRRLFALSALWEENRVHYLMHKSAIAMHNMQMLSGFLHKRKVGLRGVVFVRKRRFSGTRDSVGERESRSPDGDGRGAALWVSSY